MNDDTSGALKVIGAVAGAIVGGTFTVASTTNSSGTGNAVETLTEDPGIILGLTTVGAVAAPTATGIASTEGSGGDVIEVQIVEGGSGNSERIGPSKLEERATKVYDKYHKNHEKKASVEPILKINNPTTAEEIEKFINSFSSREELENWLVAAIGAREKLLKEIERQEEHIEHKKRIKK